MDRRHHRKSQDASQGGFTLIELLITVVVVILALAGYIAANSQVNQRSAEMFERSVALQAANSVIEQMRQAASSGGQFPASVTQAFPNNGAVQGFGDLTNQQVTVSYADPAADPLDVTVRVSWLARGQRAVTADLRTFVTRRLS